DGDVDGGHDGVYDRLHQRITVTAPGAGAPVLTTEPSGMLQALGVRTQELPLRPLDPEGRVFVTTDPRSGMRELVVFTGPAGGRTGVYLGGRLHRRAG
ncbi:MAG TPA: hypothetical protein VH479_11650, partial [Acidimicrobiales bacterium]